MHFVTLITDFGTRDYYAGMVKGLIYKEVRDVTVVDVTHDIAAYDIVEAAYTLQQSYRSFPRGTIHLILVSNHENPDHALVFEHKGHWFVGPNNGMFSLCFDDIPKAVYRLDLQLKNLLAIRHKAGSALNQIISGEFEQLELLPERDYVQRLHLHPIVETSEIRGSVLLIDHYGNAVLNIRRELFEYVRKGRDFEIYYKRNHPITHISEPGDDIEVDDIFCHFNDAGYMELSVNMGNAAERYDLKREETVHIQFLEK